MSKQERELTDQELKQVQGGLRLGPTVDFDPDPQDERHTDQADETLAGRLN